MKLAYSTTYHPQTQGLVERMNSVIEQYMLCIIHESGNINNWEMTLSTIELVINSLPNKSTGFSPFYLNYVLEPILPIQPLKGNEETKGESVGSFVRRVTADWEIAKENLQKVVSLQEIPCDREYRDVQYAVGDLVLLSNWNLKMKGIPDKLKKCFMGPFKIKR